MDRTLFALAFEGVRRKKRSSILIFLVLFISFGFAVMSVSLVASMSRTSQELTRDMYGEWVLAIPSGLEQDAEWLAEQRWVEQVGIARSYGTLEAGGKQFGFGTMDEGYLELGRLRMEDGRWPQAEGEIALEAKVLDALGLDYTLGQTFQVQIAVDCGSRFSAQKEYLTVTRSYTLCGVIRAYSDLWTLSTNQDQKLLLSGVVTPEEAEQVLEAARQSAPQRAEEVYSYPQYFIGCPTAAADACAKEVGAYLFETIFDRPGRDTYPSSNPAAFMVIEQQETDRFYLKMIALVTVVAALCVYLMQLPEDLRSLATLRSLGGSRGQLTALLLTETGLVWLPAVLLGIPLGAAGTWAVLELVVYAGSLPVHFALPFAELGGILLLWAGAVALARLLTLALLLRLPLVGRIQLQGRWARWVRRGQQVLLVALLGVFSGLTLWTALEAQVPLDQIQVRTESSFYSVYCQSSLITPAQAETYVSLPGMSRLEVVPYVGGVQQAGLSFPGFEEQMVNLYVLDLQDWTEFLDPGEDAEAFEAGELVYYCLPEDPLPLDLELNPILKDPPLPEQVTLTYYDEMGAQIAQTATAARVQRVPVFTRNLLLSSPYTIVCSQAYLENLLAQMQPGSRWGRYFEAGGAFGYTAVLFAGDPTTVTFAHDQALAQLSSRYGHLFSSRRQDEAAYIQSSRQDLVMMTVTCLCIGVIVLALSASILQLEAQGERRSQGILWALGLSRRRALARRTGKAALRAGVAFTAGWAVVGASFLLRARQALERFAADGVELDYTPLSYAGEYFRTIGWEPGTFLAWGGGILAVMVLLLWAAKHRPGKPGLRDLAGE